MRFALFDAPADEPSRFVGFAGNRVDRQSEHRSDDCMARALAAPGVRVMVLQPGRLVLRAEAGGQTARLSVEDAAFLDADLANAILLGTVDGAPLVAALTAREPESIQAPFTMIEHRPVYVQGLIGEAELGELAQAAALLSWHASHRFCGRCGQPSEMRAGGYRRHCPACGTDHFPRTDPVAIMLTVTPERCLMGRGRHFLPGMYSALAGFIEPGETIEDAVRRETFEEAGIRLGRVVYHASQPWPFPYSLMIGCFGEALNEDITADASELEDCRWFDRAEVLAMLAGAHADGLKVPPGGAIAHHLIRAWADSR